MTHPAADKKEFTKVCQAVGVGFLIMGATGYLVKLSMFSGPSSVPHMRARSLTVFFSAVHIPVNNILVGGA